MFPSFQVNGSKYKVFEGKAEDRTLKDCDNAGYDALYMPSLVDLYLRHPSLLENKDNAAKTPSLHIIGQTKQGARIQIYSHIPVEINFFGSGISLNLGKGRVSAETLESLISQDGRTDEEGTCVVSIIPFVQADLAINRKQSFAEALENIHTPAFFGNTSRAERYFNLLEQKGKNDIDLNHKNYEEQDISIAYMLVLDGNALYAGKTWGFGRFFARERVTGEQEISTRDISAVF